MVKRMVILLLTVVVLTAVGGCNYEELAQNSDTDYGSRQANDPKMLASKAYGQRSNDVHQHNNSFFEYSSAISRKVTELNGIASAIVMTTDKNAYVAILLDMTAVGTTNSGAQREQVITGSTGDVYKNVTGSTYSKSSAFVTPYNSFFSVNDINNLSDELKQTVALKVREMAPYVQEVHISANMEFVNYFNEFAKEAWGGRSLMPWVDLFNTVVQYHFAGGNVMPPPITQLETSIRNGELMNHK